MGIVWLAGPLSGLTMQPIVGALSDSSNLKFGKRRSFILMGGIGVIIALLLIGWGGAVALEITKLEVIKKATVILGFYLLDFGLNIIQICGQSLVVESVGIKQQSKANNYGVKLGYFGSILGYFVGCFDLVELMPIFGNNQIQPFCFICIVAAFLCIGLTLYYIKETTTANLHAKNKNIGTIFSDLLSGIKELPSFISILCWITFLASFVTFPYMFYSSTWINNFSKLPSNNKSNSMGRAGSIAFVLSSIISVLTLYISPKLLTSRSNINKHLTASTTWKTKILLNLPQMLTAALCVYSALFIIGTILAFNQAIAISVVVLAGVPSVIIKWATSSLMGEFITYVSEKPTNVIDLEDLEKEKADVSVSVELIDSNESSITNNILAKHLRCNVNVATGTMFGIANLYVVVPQLIVNLLSTVIFSFSEFVQSSYNIKTNGISILFFIGGLFGIFSAILSLRLWKD